MPKKLLFYTFFLTVLFCSAANIFAFDWGIQENYEDDYQDYAVLKLINNQPIKFFMIQDKTEEFPSVRNNDKEEILSTLNKQLTEEQRNNKLKSLITRAFNIWPRDTKNNIEWAKREQEFADIMPYLSRKIILKEAVNKDDADIVFRFTSISKAQEECGKDSLGCFIPYDKIIIVPTMYDNNSAKTTPALEERTYYILIHEIGHFFGLTDQYEDTGRDSLTHSTFNRTNSSDAVMGSSHNLALYCDDVDGFINVLDLTLALKNNGKFLKRAQNGWASFCNGKKNGKGQPFKDEFYKEAKLTNKPEYIRNFCLYKYNENGDIAKKHCLDPFDFADNKVEHNRNYLPLTMIDNKNKLKFSYDYHFDEEYFKVYVLGIGENNKNTLYPTFRYEKMNTNEDSYTWLNIKKDFDGTMIEISKDSCLISEPIETKDTSVEYIDMVFDKDNYLDSITYQFDYSQNPKGIEKLHPFEVAVDIRDQSCSLIILNQEIIKFKISDKMTSQVIYQNQGKINELTKKHNIPTGKLFEETSNLCQKQLSSSLVQRNVLKCKYFRNLDNFVN